MLLLKIYTEEEIKWLEDFARKKGGDPTKIRKHLEELNRQEQQKEFDRSAVGAALQGSEPGRGAGEAMSRAAGAPPPKPPDPLAGLPTLSGAAPGFRGNAPAPPKPPAPRPAPAADTKTEEKPPVPPPAAGEGTGTTSGGPVEPPPLGPPAVSTTPSAATTQEPRFKAGEAPPLTSYTPGAPRDFSAEEAKLSEIGKIPGGLGGFGESFLRGLLPRYEAMRERETEDQRAIAERSLQREQARADREFDANEQMKRAMYLSDYQQRQGKQYYTDTKTGTSGWYTPMEIAGLQASDEKMQMERQKLEFELSQAQRTGALTQAQIDYYKALAEKANNGDEMAAVVQMALNERAKLEEQARISGNPLATPLDTTAIDALNAELARRAGVQWPPPGAAATPPPAAPPRPTEVNAQTVGATIQGFVAKGGVTAAQQKELQRLVESLPDGPEKDKLRSELPKLRIIQ